MSIEWAERVIWFIWISKIRVQMLPNFISLSRKRNTKIFIVQEFVRTERKHDLTWNIVAMHGFQMGIAMSYCSFIPLPLFQTIAFCLPPTSCILVHILLCHKDMHAYWKKTTDSSCTGCWYTGIHDVYHVHAQS